LKRALATFAALAAFAPASAGAIVGGSQVSSIADFPFQVELWNQAGGNPVDGFFCGGVILDATHIATAAHCVFDESSGQATPPEQLHVLAGTNDLQAPGTDTVAAAASFDPRYDPSSNDYDFGVVTLSAPLWTGTAPAPDGTNKIAPISLIGLNDPGGSTAATKPATVSGWGDMNTEPVSGSPHPSYPTKLRSVGIKFWADSACSSSYATISLPISPRMICAADSGKDSCYGDSGGPLVVGTAPANYVLAGLVESGAGCAQASFPGIYDRVANTDVQGFVTSNPPTAPRLSVAPSISGSPAAGQTVTCQPGGWSGATGFAYEFFKDMGTQAQPQLLAGPTASGSYTVQGGDVGTQVFCVVKAAGPGGYGFGVSPDVTGAAPVITTPPSRVVDTSQPTLAVARRSCSTRGRCVVNVLVTDASPSAGIARVAARLRWRTVVKCHTRKSGRCTKMKTKTLRAKAIGGGHFVVTATRLKAGAYTLLMTAYDKAGNKQKRETRITLRVKKRHHR
jgi:hypothetical protein